MVDDESVVVTDAPWVPLPLVVEEQRGRRVRRAGRAHLTAGRWVAALHSERYIRTVWGEVPLTQGTERPTASFPGVVDAVARAHPDAFRPASAAVAHDVRSTRVIDPDAVGQLAAWFLLYDAFKMCFSILELTLLFGTGAVKVSDETSAEFCVPTTQYVWSHLFAEAPEDRDVFVLGASMAVNRSLWKGPPPERW